jgi:hypothetical protein
MLLDEMCGGIGKVLRERGGTGLFRETGVEEAIWKNWTLIRWNN